MRGLFRMLLVVLAVAAGVGLTEGRASAAGTCPTEFPAADAVKPNKLYLYFPTSSVPWTVAGPLAAFSASGLSSYTGTISALEDAVHTVVVDDYCEFDVQVLQTTSAPPTTFPRRNTVGIGSDSNSGLFGQAQNVDIGDTTAVDFAHEWAGTYQTLEGGSGQALNGANSTLDRWAKSIGGTAAHEAGHNYGLAHTDDCPALASPCTGGSAAGEDAYTNHLMPPGFTLTGENRACCRRHFSDKTFSILASNVGLAVQTMWNWNLTNPNAQTAKSLRMDFLAPQGLTPVVSWWYDCPGCSSPWGKPTVGPLLGPQTFKGTTYDHYQVTWSTPTASNWTDVSTGASRSPGLVPGGAAFHVGTNFSNVNFNLPDPIIITKIALLDASGNPLTLQPRVLGADSGTLDAADGALNINFANLAGATPLILENVTVRELPRVLAITAMSPRQKRLVDWTGLPFNPWPKSTRLVLKQSKPIEKGQSISVTVARMSEPRHIYEPFTAADCKKALAGGDAAPPGKRPDVLRCHPGISTDLFPATTLYLTATVVDPAAKHWDPKAKRYVVGPVSTPIFLQIAGRHPDLNRNKVDDVIDIRTGKSADKNRDGVPDEAQRAKQFSFLSSMLRIDPRL